MVTVEQAREALKAGKRVRMVVGTDAEDPTLVVWFDGECVMSAAVAGWSAGVVEPVCDAGSAFLTGYLSGRESLTIEEG